MIDHVIFARMHFHGFHSGHFYGGTHGTFALVFVVICLLVAGVMKWWTDRE